MDVKKRETVRSPPNGVTNGQSVAARAAIYTMFAVRAPRVFKLDIAALLNVNSADAERFNA